jgi:hypothetical protein
MYTRGLGTRGRRALRTKECQSDGPYQMAGNSWNELDGLPLEWALALCSFDGLRVEGEVDGLPLGLALIEGEVDGLPLGSTFSVAEELV